MRIQWAGVLKSALRLQCKGEAGSLPCEGHPDCPRSKMLLCPGAPSAHGPALASPGWLFCIYHPRYPPLMPAGPWTFQDSTVADSSLYSFKTRPDNTWQNDTEFIFKKKKVQVFKKCSYTLCSTTPFLRIYTTEIIAVLNNSRQRYMCRDVGCSIVCNYGKEREPTQESIKRGLGNKRRRSHTMQCWAVVKEDEVGL